MKDVSILDLDTEGPHEGLCLAVAVLKDAEGIYSWRGAGQIIPEGSIFWDVAYIYFKEEEGYFEPVSMEIDLDLLETTWERGCVGVDYDCNGYPVAAQFYRPLRWDSVEV